LASARKKRKRERKALGFPTNTLEAKAPLPKQAPRISRSQRPCWNCAHGCRTEKKIYGWVCANCAYEFDWYFSVLTIFHGPVGTAEAFAHAKAHGMLPPPEPRGRGVNVRKPGGIPVAIQFALATHGITLPPA
jgi:hypothetical protein